MTNVVSQLKKKFLDMQIKAMCRLKNQIKFRVNSKVMILRIIYQIIIIIFTSSLVEPIKEFILWS